MKCFKVKFTALSVALATLAGCAGAVDTSEFDTDADLHDDGGNQPENGRVGELLRLGARAIRTAATQARPAATTATARLITPAAAAARDLGQPRRFFATTPIVQTRWEDYLPDSMARGYTRVSDMEIMAAQLVKLAEGGVLFGGWQREPYALNKAALMDTETYKLAELRWKGALFVDGRKDLYPAFWRIVSTDESVAANGEWLSEALKSLMTLPLDSPSCYLAQVLNTSHSDVNWTAIPGALETFKQAYTRTGRAIAFRHQVVKGKWTLVPYEPRGKQREVRRDIAKLISDATQTGKLDPANEEVKAALAHVADSLP